MSDGQLYELKISASGEVRDAEGNLIGQQPVEATVTVTEEQAAAIRQQLDKGE